MAFHTFGCKVNQFDTEGLVSKFSAAGYEIVPFTDEADVYVINTCTVTKTAEQKARQLTRKVKRNHPRALVVVTGCYAQTNPEDLQALPEADLITGVAGREELVNLVNQMNQDQESFFSELSSQDTSSLGCGHPKPRNPQARMKVSSWGSNPDFRVFTPEFTERTRAFIKIEDGCESYCSYCKIPFARGPVRSLPPAQVMGEVRRLRASGFKELVLVGIHLGNYGKDQEKNLADLLKELEKENASASAEGFRIRLGSVEPMDFTPELIKVISESRFLCPHFHIPLQSGSDTVLKRMNRHYTTNEYAELLERLRVLHPNLSISTDLMVGFPGETENEFQASLDFIKRQRFSRIHIFPYSRREGTKAAQMPSQLLRKEIEERAARAEEVAQAVVSDYRKGLFGKRVAVLIEEKVAPETWEGFCGEYLRVRLVGAYHVNSMVQARVTGVDFEPLQAVDLSPEH